MAKAKKVKEENEEVAEVSSKEESMADRIKRLNKLFGKEVELFSVDSDEDCYGNYERIPTGVKEVDEILGGGFPRGTIAELYGPEGSGKTWLLTKLYAQCCKMGLRFWHIDAEQSFNKIFAEQNGVDMKQMHICQTNILEPILGAIEKCCATNEFAVIGIDSLASLMSRVQDEKDMGEKTMGSIASAMSICLPKLAPAIKKGNVLLIFINQLRQTIGGYAAPGMPVPEHTPGGKTLKFFASTRVEVKRILPKKSERSDMYEGERIVGHVLKVKVSKSRTCAPFGEAFCDLWYNKMPESYLIVKRAIDDGVIERARSNHKKFTYDDLTAEFGEKNDYKAIVEWLRDRKIFCEFLTIMGVDNFTPFLENEELTEEEVSDYINSLKGE